MANIIVFVIVFVLLSQNFAFDFKEDSILEQAERHGVFDLTAKSSAKNFNEQTCTNQLNLFSNALTNREFWALRRELSFILSKSKIIEKFGSISV